MSAISLIQIPVKGKILTTMNNAVAAVTLGPIVHRKVYGRSRVTGFENVFWGRGMVGGGEIRYEYMSERD